MVISILLLAISPNAISQKSGRTESLANRVSKPQLLVPLGHSHAVLAVALSPDGRYALTGSADWNAILWDASTGREVRRFEGHKFHVTTVAFSPDSRFVLTGGGNKYLEGDDRSARLWDITTGEEIRQFIGHTAGIWAVAFSPDGRFILTGSSDKSARLWDAKTGKELQSFKHPDKVEAVAFSPDNAFALTGGSDGKAYLWEVGTGHVMQRFDGHSGRVTSVAFIPGTDQVLTGSTDGSVRLWRANTGQELTRIAPRPIHDIHSLAVTPDGRSVLVGGSRHGFVGLYETMTDREIWRSNSIAEAVTLSADGKLALTGSAIVENLQDNSTELLNAATGKTLRSFNGASGLVNSAAISRDRRYIFSGGTAATAGLWDTEKGEMIWRCAPHMKEIVDNTKSAITIEARSHAGLDIDIAVPMEVKSSAFSPDGRFVLTGMENLGAILWDTETGRIVRIFNNQSGDTEDNVLSVAFSADSTQVATGNKDGMARLWDVGTGKEIQHFKGHTRPLNSLAISADGRSLLTGSSDKTACLWDITTGQITRCFKHKDIVFSVALSPDRKFVLTGGGGYWSNGDRSMHLWDVASGQERQFNGHTSGLASVAFSTDGRLALSGSLDGTACLWRVATGKELRCFQGHVNTVHSVAFSSDGRFVLTGSHDGTIRYWDLATGQELCRLISLRDGSWLVVTSDGLFDGSPAAWEQLRWRFSPNPLDTVPIEAYFGDFYYPGLLADIFAGKRPKAPSNISLKDRHQPQLKLTSTDSAATTLRTPRNVNVKIDIFGAAAGAQDVRLFRNGSLVKIWRGDVLKGQSSAKLEATIPIVAGENRFTAYAFNHDNIKSSDATLVVTGAYSLKRAGTAYVLAVGVNIYSNTNYNLKYAVSDAEDFSAEIKRQQDALKKYERVEVIPLYDRDATKANILGALSELAAKAQPEDAVIVYFSGHGTAAQQRFYLIPHDLGYQGPRTKLSQADLKAILEHGISDREMEAAFEKIDAGQLLMVIDACNSGQALDSEEKRRGPMNSKGLAQLAYEKGMYILTAAQSYQAAWEASRLGHGYLTYSLIEEGLKQNAADREPKNNEIVLREWLNYATDRVPQMQEQKLKEKPKRGDRRGARELEFVFVEGDQTIKDPTKRNIQRPRVFYRRELESSPLIVARPQAGTLKKN